MRKLHLITLSMLLLFPAPLFAQTGPLAAPATAPAAGAQPSESSMKAAAEIAEYIETHEDAQKKLMDAGIRPPLRAEMIDKLRPILPPELAAKLDTARPAFEFGARRSQEAGIASNLKGLGQMFAIYASQYADRLPATLTDLLKEKELPLQGMTLSVLKALVRPGTEIPDEIAKAAPDKQEAWVKANTPFVFLRLGEKWNGVAFASQVIVAAEDPAKAPGKEKLYALFSDGHVAPTERKTIEDAVKVAATRKSPN